MADTASATATTAAAMPAGDTDMTSSTLLKSAYELAREERIKQNEAKLRALGLMSAKENLVAVTAPPPKKAPAKRKKPTAPAQPSRKSRRKQGAAPEYAPSASVGGDDVLFADADGEDEEAAAAREAAAAAVQAERERRYERLFLRHAEEGLELPETASYGHTVMRVDTMSEAALSNRVRVIERAAGSYAVIKMKQFAEVLIMEGYEEVSKEADAALQRLLELPKFKGKNWAQMLELGKTKKKK